jgi:TetR/AcrR family transcriptional repressor of bet genes
VSRPARRPRRRTAAPLRPRASRARQRQRLIDACISALHVHGPSNTTVEKVVAIARMSPGIVRFYFDSKAAMMVASLEFLAAEFEQRLLVPVAELKATPVQALERLVELYLDPEIASPRKVSVWYSFWGEASSRQEYYDICGKKDDSFAELTRELVGRLIAATGARHLDADAIALGLIGVLEMLWQGFAFQTESQIDRAAARLRCMAYLRSVFPGAFASDDGVLYRAATTAAGSTAIPPARLPAAAYSSAALLAAERRELLAGAWQLVALADELPVPGDCLTIDLPAARALVLRDADGGLRAFHNECPRLPHALVTARSTRLLGAIDCALHGLRFRFDGARLDGGRGSGLTPLELAEHAGFAFVRRGVGGATPLPDLGDAVAAGLRRIADSPLERAVAADWKVLAELWLEFRSAAAAPILRSFAAPNQFIERSGDGALILQLVPVSPGHCLLRCFDFRAVHAAAFAPQSEVPAARAARRRLAEDCALAESVQLGLESRIAMIDAEPAIPPAVAEFRRAIARLLPPEIANARDPVG